MVKESVEGFIFNMMIGKEDLIHKVTFKQRPNGDEGA